MVTIEKLADYRKGWTVHKRLFRKQMEYILKKLFEKKHSGAQLMLVVTTRLYQGQKVLNPKMQLAINECKTLVMKSCLTSPNEK